MSQSGSGSASSGSLLPVTADRTTITESANVTVAPTHGALWSDFYSLPFSQLPHVPAGWQIHPKNSDNPSYPDLQASPNLSPNRSAATHATQQLTQPAQQQSIAVSNPHTAVHNLSVVPQTPETARYGSGDAIGLARSTNFYRYLEHAVLTQPLPLDPVSVIEAIRHNYPDINDELAKHDIITNLDELISYLQSGKKLEKSTVDGMVECLASAIRESSIKPIIRFKSVGAVAGVPRFDLSVAWNDKGTAETEDQTQKTNEDRIFAGLREAKL